MSGRWSRLSRSLRGSGGAKGQRQDLPADLRRAPAGAGRADLHIHSAASDGLDGVSAILAAVEARGDLDVIAITDHDRIDAALAARTLARHRAYRTEIVVGEEVTTRGGHLLALFIEERIPPLRAMSESIGMVHEQGGIAIPAHPLVPYPLCVQGWTLRRLLAAADPRVRPDALETFNPTTAWRRWHPRVVAFTESHGLAGVGNSDAHLVGQIGQGWTSFQGTTGADLRAAIAERRTVWHGAFYPPLAQVGMVGRQYEKKARDLSADLRGRLLRRGMGRDLGYPGGERRPPVLILPEIEGQGR
jgi:predicted metal-dependent phosphoesterase TrpH